MVAHLLILTLILLILWLNQIGVPGFVKRPLLDALRRHGIELQFSRLRLNFVHGLVADNVHIGGEAPDLPSLAVQEIHLQINYPALLHRQFELNGIVLRQGQFTLPVSATNELPCVLTLDHIQTELRFETNDTWSLDNFQANFAGARFVLSGELLHAQQVTNWQMFQHRKTAAPGVQMQWRKIATELSQIHFDQTSRMGLSINGDARDIHSLRAVLTVSAPDAETPWGSAHNVELVARSHASGPTPGLISGLPGQIDWKAQLARLQSQQLNADFISCAGFWRTPDLEVTNLYARLGRGHLQAAAGLDINTRRFSFTNSSCFDPNAIAALLTDKTTARLSQFSFWQPPALQAHGSLVLPDWTNRAPDVWRTLVQPSVRLDGELDMTDAAFSGFPLEETHAHFSYSNEIWNIPDAVISRREGTLAIAGTENDATKNYQWYLHGAISPGIIQSFLTTKAARQFTNFVFTEPAFFDIHVGGRLYDYNSINATGRAALTNFSVRGESVDSVETDFSYSNLVAVFYSPHLQAGLQTMHADGVRLDWPGDRIYFTNGLGTADPQKVVNAIGPLAAQALRPYHFLQLPTARVTGYAPLRDPTNADLDFLVIGTVPLQWSKLKTPAITGEVHWIGQSLILTNLAASVYRGQGTASAHFDFRPHNGAYYSFQINLTNVNVHDLATDLAGPTNHFEGRLSGLFIVTSAYSQDWRTCMGYGYADLRDGLIWDEPVFGILSPFLNAVSPGLGNSRATDATARFFMTNGVISTDTLDIHAAMLHLRYDGTVDLQGNLKAHLSAELLRDVPGIGSVVNFLTAPVTKIFEYKVGGTLQQPKYKPVYIPKFLIFMLHPIQALKDLLPQDNGDNAPPPSP
jgi:hypothetical protein